MLPNSLVPLCVPTWEEREALEAGALYSDSEGFHLRAETWREPFWRWLPRMFDPDALQPVLLPDMLPVTTWEQNIREKAGPQVWDRLRKHAYRAAGFRCEICGEGGKLEAHECWTLENETCTQRLVKIMALCPLCHKAHHLGIAQRLGMLQDVRKHLCRVNGWSSSELDAQIAEAHEIWEQRCHWPWEIDMGWLWDSGYLYV